MSHGGGNYRCLQGHTSLLGWEPPNVPALWQYDSAATAEAPLPPAAVEPPAKLTLDYVTIGTSCDDAPESCCPKGTTVVRGTAGDDVLRIKQPARCVLGLTGRDTVSFASTGPSALLLGSGDDTAIGGPGDDFIAGGPGNDTLNAYGGDNLVFGGAGRDTLYVGNGSNQVVPGPGADVVACGGGDDTVYIFDLCEVERGETLDGGAGNDTLVAPVDLATLQAMGVSVTNFESVRVEHNTCRSECVPKATCSVGDLQRCVDGLAPREGLEGKAADLALQEDIVRYCTGVGLAPCAAQLISRANVEFTAAAVAIIGASITPAEYLAYLHDRHRKLDKAEADASWATQVCAGPDDDDDWVPNALDECPGTPPMRATFDNGCEDTDLPKAPSAEDMKRLFDHGGFLFSEKCTGALPSKVSPVGAFFGDKQTYYFLASRVKNQPQGCPLWYFFEIVEFWQVTNPPATIRHSVAYRADQEVPTLRAGSRPVPDPYIQFPVPRKDMYLPVDAGWGYTTLLPDVRFRVRVMNGAGLRSDWSDWWSGLSANDARALKAAFGNPFFL